MAYINVQELAQIEAGINASTGTPAIAWHSVGRSHAGCVRELNEDAFLNSIEQNLWVVADGMGGHSRGDYASKVVVESLVHFAAQQSLPASIVNLEARLREAHEICRTTFRGERVGSTAVALFSYAHYGFFLWAGDSRVYRLREGELVQMTTDHTVGQEKCARGELRPGQLALHPSAHVLTRAVGVHQTLHMELHYDTVQQGDRYLLCSDGLYNDQSLADIQQCLAQASAEEALDALVEGALNRGGRDNITAIVVEAAR